MTKSLASALAATLVLCAVAHASPLAPVELRVSDSQSWLGADGAATGVSGHPFFRVRHLVTGNPSPAVKLRVQVSADESFATLLWDSDFVPIAPTGSKEVTPALAYAGPSLQHAGVYFWRAAVKDSEQAASAFSPPATFTMSPATSGVDLRVTTGVGAEEVQGDPVSVTAWPPLLTAEYAGGENPATLAMVQISLTSDFLRLIWQSNFLPVGTLAAGQRTPSIPIEVGQAYSGWQLFWRIRFSPNADPGSEGPWSAAKASFVYAPQDPAIPPPGGFSRSALDFGSGQHPLSHTAVGDINGNGTPDVVTVSGTPEGMHTLYLDPGTASPGQPILFGGECSGRTIAAVHDFRLNGTQSVAVIDQNSARLYTYNGGAVALFDMLELGFGDGEPVAVEVADVNWDGWPDLLVAFETAVYAIMCGQEGFTSSQAYTNHEFVQPITDLLATNFNLKDDLHETWVLSGGTLYLFRGFDWLQQQWTIDGATKLTLADEGQPLQPELVLARPGIIQHCTLSVESDLIELVVDAVVESDLSEPVADVAGRELTGDGLPDIVLVAGGSVTVLRRAEDTYEVHEYAGHAGGLGVTNVVIRDMNGDAFPDIVVGRAVPSHSFHLSTPRLSLSIAGSHATQQEFGQAFATFQVTLSAAPVSTVEVWCETFEEDNGGGGDGDGDGLPNTASLVTGQLGSLGYVPTGSRLVFVPGQTVAWFRVPLTSISVSTQWSLQARMLSPVGATLGQTTATATIYATPSSSASGAPPTGPGMTRDWRIDGEVRAIARSGNNTYFGGQFDGINWEAQGVAALDEDGGRRVALPKVSGTIEAVAIDAGTGDIYFGGMFTLNLGQGQTIKNLAKCLPDGSLVASFAPNPNGRVNAIAIDTFGRIYFGGMFTALEGAPGMAFANIAWVSTSGLASTALYGGANCFGVKNTTTSFAEVLVMKISESGPRGKYLLVGGQYFNSALANSSTYAVGNFVGFSLSGFSALTQPTVPGGAVRAIEVNTNGPAIGTSGDTSYAIFLGGTFSYARWQWGSTSVYSGQNLAVTNFSGFYNAALSAANSSTAVHALARDANNRLWLGRSSYGSAGTVNPIVIYDLNGGLLAQHSAISGDNGVLGFAPGDGTMRGRRRTAAGSGAI